MFCRYENPTSLMPTQMTAAARKLAIEEGREGDSEWLTKEGIRRLPRHQRRSRNKPLRKGGNLVDVRGDKRVHEEIVCRRAFDGEVERRGSGVRRQVLEPVCTRTI